MTLGFCLRRPSEAWIKKKFREFADNLSGNKIQALIQMGNLEVLEKELDQLVNKNDSLGEKCSDVEDVEYIQHGVNDLEVSSTLRNWRSNLLNRKQELLKRRKKRLRNLCVKI